MRRDEGEEFWQKLECGKRNCGIHDGPPMLFGIGFSVKTRKIFESRRSMVGGLSVVRFSDKL